MKISIEQSDASSGQMFVLSHRGDFIADADNCPCGSFKAMLLPCKHILAIRKMLGLSLFSHELCGRRWVVNHYVENHYAFQEASVSHSVEEAGDVSIAFHESSTATILTEQEKYRKAFKVAQETATTLSHLGTSDFMLFFKRLKQTHDLIRKRVPFLVISARKGITDIFNFCPSQYFVQLLMSLTPPSLKETVMRATKWAAAATRTRTRTRRAKMSLTLQCRALRNQIRDPLQQVNAQSRCELHKYVLLDQTLTIKLPEKMLKRGRPKGAGLNVIGLPAAKRKKNSSKPVKFTLKSPTQREKCKII